MHRPLIGNFGVRSEGYDLKIEIQYDRVGLQLIQAKKKKANERRSGTRPVDKLADSRTDSR